LAIFIIPGNKNGYLNAVEVCSALWGGVYFPIIPFYRILSKKFRREYKFVGKTRDFYQNTIENFDPDVIVHEDTIDPESIIPFISGRAIVPLSRVIQSFNEKEDGYGISFEIILSALKEKEFKFHRSDNLRLSLPHIDSSNLLAATLLGTYSSKIHQKLATLNLHGRYCSTEKLNDKQLESYYDSDVLTAIKVTQHTLENSEEKGWGSNAMIFFLNPNRLEDLVLFWNLRAMGSNMLAVPIDEYYSNFWRSRIFNHQVAHQQNVLTNSLSIHFGDSITEKQIGKVQDFLQFICKSTGEEFVFPHYWWIPRFWYDSKDLHFDRAWAISPRGRRKEVIFDWDMNSILRVKVLKPDFDITDHRSKKLCFVNNIEYAVDGMQPQYAQVLPNIPSDKIELLTRWGYKQWRFSPKSNSFLSAGWSDNIEIIVPNSERVFSEWFAYQNLTIRHSASGKLATQFLANIGYLYGVNMFANPGLLPILILFEGGKIVSKEALFNEATKQFRQHKSHFWVKGIKEVVEGLIKKGVIQAGFKIQCLFCNQYSFYTINDLNEKLRCPVCQNVFVTPVHSPDNIKWSYRGLGPFSRNNRAEGMISVLLTLRFFRLMMQHDPLITSTLSFDIFENDKLINEVDLALFYKEFGRSSQPTDLFFCECKTEIDFKIKDIQRMKELGIRFPGSILVFTTLKLQLSEQEKQLIGKLVKYFRGGIKFRPRNLVLILTGNELLERLQGLKHFKEEIRYSGINHDLVAKLCDITCREYLGIPKHESDVSKRIEIKQRKLEAENIKKKALIIAILDSLLSRNPRTPR